MNKLLVFFILFMAVLISACSNRQIYEAIQNNQKLECQKLQQDEYEKCMDRLSESYDQYQNKRQE